MFEFGALQALFLQLGSRLVRSLARHQRLGLGEEVRQQNGVVFAAADRVLRLGGCDEVAGDEAGALVDELVEGMLAVGPRFAPDNRAS